MIIHKRKRPRSSENEINNSWFRLLGTTKPISMILRLYSKLVLCWDFSYFVIFSIISVLQSIKYTLRPPALKSLDGEIALVVGSSRGVGRELVLKLIECNAIVICVDINTQENEVIVKNAKLRGGNVYGYTCDVSNKDQVQQVISAIEKDVGDITMLYHCCSIPSLRSLVTNPPSIETTMELNVLSHFWLLDAILPKMKRMKHGHIVLLTSVAGLSGLTKQMPLSVSQFAIQGLFESIVEELRIEKLQNIVNASIVHVYPFMICDNLENDVRLRIPSFFGTIRTKQAAENILIGVRRNQMEISIPKYLLYIGHIFKLLPRRATYLMRELLDTGVDFG